MTDILFAQEIRQEVEQDPLPFFPIPVSITARSKRASGIKHQPKISLMRGMSSAWRLLARYVSKVEQVAAGSYATGSCATEKIAAVCGSSSRVFQLRRPLWQLMYAWSGLWPRRHGSPLRHNGALR